MEPAKTEARYDRLPDASIYWHLVYEGGTRIHKFVTPENGVESNKAEAKNAAEHAKCLTDDALARAASA